VIQSLLFLYINILPTVDPVATYFDTEMEMRGRSRRLGAQRPIVIKLSHGRSVGLSVCPVHCAKTADRIRTPFRIVGRTGPVMRQIVGFGDRSTRRGTFGGEFEALHCNQWGLYGLGVR